MKIAWKEKTLYTKKAQWSLRFYVLLGVTTFYFLPTIEYFRDKTFDDDGDCYFAISFEWLFWKISIERYWGSYWA